VNVIRDEYLSYNLDSSDDRGFFSRDLSNPRLVFLAKQLTTHAPAFLRVGGSGGNWLWYDMRNGTCDGLQGWKEGANSQDACLNSSHWAAVNHFASSTGARLIFGLRNKVGVPELRAFLQHSISQNFSIFGIEPSNEEGCPPRSDLALIINLLRELYPQEASRPQLLGADTVGKPIAALQAFLNMTASLGMPALAGTYHSYPGNVAAGAAQLAALRTSVSPGTELWVGETAADAGGCASHAVGQSKCGTFNDGYWWLGLLGGLAPTHACFLRQTLIGGGYGLLRDGDPCGWNQSRIQQPPCVGPRSTNQPFYPANQMLEPNPDWWSAVLFKKLIGRGVLGATLAAVAPVTPASAGATAATAAGLRAFAFCSRTTHNSSSSTRTGGVYAGVTLLLVNPSNENHSVHLDLEGVGLGPAAVAAAQPKQQRLVWELTQVRANRTQKPLVSIHFFLKKNSFILINVERCRGAD
jgi:hypothetical protein